MVSSNNRGVVDHMLSGVGLNMLLDRDLGNMVDLVVDIVSNMVNNRSSGNNSWGSVDSDSWGSMNSSNSGGSFNLSNYRSSSSNCGHSWSSDMSSAEETMITSEEKLRISISCGSSVASGNRQEDSLQQSYVIC